MRWAFAAVALLAVACTPAPVVASPSPASPAPSASSAPTAVATAPPSPTPGLGRSAPSSVAVTAIGALPRDFVYVETSPQNDVTFLLVDLSGAAPPISVVRWTGGNSTSAISDDGQTIIVSAPGDRSKYALMLVKPFAGRATVLFDGPADGRVFYPRLSPDGRRFAFQLYRDRGTDGYFVGETATGTVTNLMNAPATGGLLDWSADGTSITYSSDQADPLGGQHVYMSSVVDGSKTTIGPGNLDALRAGEPKVVTAMVGGRGIQGAFGADVSVYDTAARRETKLFAIEPRITMLRWSPARDEFVFLQGRRLPVQRLGVGELDRRRAPPRRDDLQRRAGLVVEGRHVDLCARARRGQRGTRGRCVDRPPGGDAFRRAQAVRLSVARPSALDARP